MTSGKLKEKEKRASNHKISGNGLYAILPPHPGWVVSKRLSPGYLPFWPSP